MRAAVVLALLALSGCACLEPGPVVYHYGSYHRDLGGSISRPVSVPEPGSLALLGIGLAGLAVARRKR